MDSDAQKLRRELLEDFKVTLMNNLLTLPLRNKNNLAFSSQRTHGSIIK
jgi:hypothetical protein